MKWNGRKHIPINANIINRNKKKFDFEEALKPLGKKQLPVWESVVAVNTSVQGPTPFEPSSITGLAIWLDADDNTTLDLVGDRVQSWTSKGSVPVVFSASTTARRPQYITTGNTGSSPAIKFLSASTAANRSGLVTDNNSSFSTNFGYTAFVIGKSVDGYGSAAFRYNQVNSLLLWNNASTNAFQSKQIQVVGRTGIVDFIPTAATAGYNYNYQTNGNLTTAASKVTPYFFHGQAVDYNNMFPVNDNPKSYDKINGRLKSTLSTNTISTYSGKTFNSYSLVGTKVSGTESVTNTQNTEFYEILFYNRALTQNEFDSVISYLENKWNIPASDYSQVAKVNVNWIGKTGTTTDTVALNQISPSQFYYTALFGEVSGQTVLDTTQTSFVSTQQDATGFNWLLTDSNGYTVTSGNCIDVNVSLTLSAGTYNLSGETSYTCIPLELLLLDGQDSNSINSGSTQWNAVQTPYVNNSYATLTNGAAYTTSYNGGVSYDGVDDYSKFLDENSLDYNVLQGLTQWSILMWVEPRTLTDYVRFFGSPSDNFELGILSNNLAWHTNGTSWITTSAALSANTPCQIVASYNVSYAPDRLKVFFNGNLISSSTTASVTSSGGFSTLGASNVLSNFLDGNIYNFTLYQEHLSPEAVTELWNAQKSNYGY